MPIRRIMLVAMLVILGLCAVVGVLAALVFSGEILWRVLGTAIDTAVATGLLLPLTFLIPRPRFRIGGLAGMGVILAARLCLLAAIWTIDYRAFQIGERLALTALFILFMGLPSAGALMLLSFRQVRVAVVAFAAGAGLAWLTCEIYVFLPDAFNDGERFLATGMTFYGISSLIAFLLVNLGCGDRRYFRWAGVAAATAGLILALVDIWDRLSYSSVYWREIFSLIIPAIVMAHINLVLLARLRTSQRWLMWSVCAFSIFSGLAAMAAILLPDLEGPLEMMSRGSAAAGIVSACGSLALIVLAVLNRKSDAAALGPGALEATALELTCPRCRLHQTVPFGNSICAQCELEFSIKVIEPRCPACGYLLYRLVSPNCPECGAPVPTARQPAPTPVAPAAAAAQP